MIDIDLSDLEVSTDPSFPDVWGAILKTHLQELADGGVSTDDLDALSAALTAFEATLGSASTHAASDFDAAGAAAAVGAALTTFAATLGTASVHPASDFDAAGAAATAQSAAILAALGLPLGLVGAVAATRYVGGTVSGPPTTGTFVAGDVVPAQNGTIWVCTVGGTPGTWMKQRSLPAVVWAATTLFRANNFVQLPTGGWGYVTADYTSRATFDATERAAWTFIPGGHYESITASTTWVKPTGITKCRVKCIGAGSGGNGGGSALTSGGVATQVGGPGSGCGVVLDAEITLAGNLTWTIGAGGAGGAGGAVNGNPGVVGTAGGTTTATDGTTTVSATGGSHGPAALGNSAAPVSGGSVGGGTQLGVTNFMPGAGGGAATTGGASAVPLGLVTGGSGGSVATTTLGGSGGVVASAPGAAAAAVVTQTGSANGGAGASASFPGHGGAGGGGGAPGGAGGAGGAGANGLGEVWF